MTHHFTYKMSNFFSYLIIKNLSIHDQSTFIDYQCRKVVN